MCYCAVCLGEHKKVLLLQQVVEGVQKIYSKNCCMLLISQLYMDLPLPPVLYDIICLRLSLHVIY